MLELLFHSYIREMEGTGLKIVAASDPNYMRTLESAIRVGEAMLLKVINMLSLQNLF